MKVLGKRDRLAAAGATAVFVVHDEPGLVRETMLRDLEVPFPVCLDRERSAYDAWGLGRTSRARVYLDPKVWLAYAGLLLQGEKAGRTGEDTGQLGGDFVVAPDGRVVYSRPQRRDDRPPVATLLAALERTPPGR